MRRLCEGLKQFEPRPRILGNNPIPLDVVQHGGFACLYSQACWEVKRNVGWRTER